VGAKLLGTGLGPDQSIYQHVNSWEIAAFGDVALIQTYRWRWSLLGGAGFGFENVKYERYPFDPSGNLIPTVDVDGDGDLDVVPIGYNVRKDTGPVFLGGTSVTFHPLEFLGIRASVLVDYRYTPELTMQEGALLLLGLLGVDAAF
jgi:hypothetical protein